MKIALYGLSVNPDFIDELLRLFDLFNEKSVECLVYRPFLEYLQHDCGMHPTVAGQFETGNDLPDDVSFLLSLGGDGTLLKSFMAAKNGSIPLVGINSGRLGFLSDISRDEIEKALDNILEGNIIIDERTVLELEIVNNNESQFLYGLNEITVTKLDSSAMINIHTYVNGEFLNTYWADGLIIATPTGSTAYSLSVGGPILTPDSENFVISPIAPHNLTVRPIVVPDHHSITLQVEGRGLQFLTSVDSKSEAIYFSVLLKIKKAPFKVKTIRLKDHSFFSTLRNKLMWGVDKRN
ncbi:MAG: NAD kinase [Prolixibacteraceae bacterium]|nr:NAD kinase [Prolixibacteraceae bacterium]